MKQATLCFLIRENQGNKELLLAIKKKGFGQGKWNGMRDNGSPTSIISNSHYFP